MMEFILEILANPYIQTMLKIFVVVTLIVMPLAGLLTYFERKWSALIHDRIGPNRANIGKAKLFGVLHVLADGLKSFFKEDFIPGKTNTVLFTIAPFFGFVAGFIVFALIPYANPVGDFTFQIAEFDSSILLIFAFTSLGVYGSVFAGWSTNNKYGVLGSLRSSAQMISYEIFLGLSLVGIFLVYGTLNITEIVAAQGEYWFGVIPKWGIFTQPLAFLLFFTALIAETKRAPFDAPEGESEIIAGYFIEYSGMRFASFFFAEYIAIIGVGALMTTFFLGGYHIPFLQETGFGFGDMIILEMPALLISFLQFGAFWVKTFFFCWLQLMIRWTVPRFRFDQIMNIGWKKLMPLSIINVVVTAVAIVIIDTFI